MMKDNKKNFCLVGYGNHAKNKLVPSVEMVGYKISAIVTSKQDIKLKYKTYSDLKQALQNLNPNTYFILSSPPTVHFSQIKEILSSGRSIYVEKPIFVDLDEAKSAWNKIKNSEFFVVELLMYKYTKLYENFLNVWNKKKNECIEIECFFNIPGVTGNSFRDSKEITSSPLYDIGCYIFSLLADLNISLENLKIYNTNIQNGKLIHLVLKGRFKQLKIHAEFGTGHDYKNQVKLKFNRNFKIVFDKFFYGVKTEKKILYEKEKSNRVYFLEDENGFKKMFEYTHSFWVKNQSDRFKNILKVNKKLSSLKRELSLTNYNI